MAEMSPLEEELWRQELALSERIKAGDLAGYLSFWHAQVSDWPDGQTAPVEREGVRQVVEAALAGGLLASAEVTLTPWAVRVFDGRVGIACYTSHVRVAAPEGGEIGLGQRVIHTWLRTDAGWRIIGGMGASLPDGQTA
ncbi:MAG: DUF4440 domain-containing protein [Anaerolineae bacterium]|nr:DUF4440 domain-containing protein [Anaerolineae bacterium]